jgi:1-acyl-sn-glycerol-3-phosphate acyltransferase
VPPGGAIVVSNHQSLLDIPVLLSALPGDVRFLAKRELGRVPVFGASMVRAGNILIDREDPREAMGLLREAGERIRKGQLLVVFPEGTRSADGTIGEFKAGAFHLARKAGAVIVPVYIDGGRAALPKGSMRIRAARMTLRVLEPLLPDEAALMSKQELAEETRRRIECARREEDERSGKPREAQAAI